jgi:hypothetical protein
MRIISPDRTAAFGLTLVTILAILASGCAYRQFISEKWVPSESVWYVSHSKALNAAYGQNWITEAPGDTGSQARSLTGCLFAADTLLEFGEHGSFRMNSVIIVFCSSDSVVFWESQIDDTAERFGSWSGLGKGATIKYANWVFRRIDHPPTKVQGSDRVERVQFEIENRKVVRVIYHGRTYVPLDSIAIPNVAH